MIARVHLEGVDLCALLGEVNRRGSVKCTAVDSNVARVRQKAFKKILRFGCEMEIVQYVGHSRGHVRAKGFFGFLVSKQLMNFVEFGQMFHVQIVSVFSIAPAVVKEHFGSVRLEVIHEHQREEAAQNEHKFWLGIHGVELLQRNELLAFFELEVFIFLAHDADTS